MILREVRRLIVHIPRPLVVYKLRQGGLVADDMVPESAGFLGPCVTDEEFFKAIKSVKKIPYGAVTQLTGYIVARVNLERL